MNIAVAQSGGPTCAINASLLGIIREAEENPKINKIFGAFNGIDGVLTDQFVDLGRAVNTKLDFDLLRQTPSSALGSCRHKLPDFEVDEEPYRLIFEVFERHQIDAFFYIGGNDSMDTVDKLSRYSAKTGSKLRVIGVPKTIDNDLFLTDHTPGFGSAAKYVATVMNEIIRDTDVYDMPSVMIVEIMGRHAGWLAASTCLLRVNGEMAPQLIYLPERPFDAAAFCEDVRAELKKNKTVVVAVSEGIRYEAVSSVTRPDGFGHVALGGVGKQLENLIKAQIGCKVRSVELNVLQRCGSHIASRTDLFEAEMVGRVAVREMMAGATGAMIAINRLSDAPYKISMEAIDVRKIANKERPFPLKWINEQNNNVTDEAIAYFLPLIQGEPQIITENGIPVHFKF